VVSGSYHRQHDESIVLPLESQEIEGWPGVVASPHINEAGVGRHDLRVRSGHADIGPRNLVLPALSRRQVAMGEGATDSPPCSLLTTSSSVLTTQQDAPGGHRRERQRDPGAPDGQPVRDREGADHPRLPGRVVRGATCRGVAEVRQMGLGGIASAARSMVGSSK
jgi:hypothetical protein